MPNNPSGQLLPTFRQLLPCIHNTGPSKDIRFPEHLHIRVCNCQVPLPFLIALHHSQIPCETIYIVDALVAVDGIRVVRLAQTFNSIC